MEITFDTTSMESLNACSEKIKAEIERIEKESRSAREKGTGKTKLVQKKNKQKDILVEYVETYEGLLSLYGSISSFKGALTRRLKREQELNQIREDEQIFAEALVAENQYAAAQKLLEEERETIHEAYNAYEENKTDLTEQRLEESRVRIQAAFANVERAKAEAERTYARLDKRFPNIHLSEANVHDAKAAYHEYQAEKARKAAGQEVQSTPVLEQTDDAHIAEIREQQRKASQADLTRVLKARKAQLESDSRKSVIAAEQKTTAAKQTAAVADKRAYEADERAHKAKIAYEQGLAAGRDFRKVMDSRASSETATEEDIARAIQTEAEAHKLETGLAQKQAAARDVSKVADARAAQARKNAHAAGVAEQQTRAAVKDTNKVINNRASQYGLTGDQVVQNLPIGSKLNEVYTTPGMGDAEVDSSKKKLDEVPVGTNEPDTQTIEAAKKKMDNFFEGNATPTITWVEMRDRINNLMLKHETDNKNLTPDDIYALYFLRKHPEAAPTKDTLNELLIWAGIVPLERTTPRVTGPAPVQLLPAGQEEVVKNPEMTDEEIEKTKHDLDHEGDKDKEHAIDGDTPKDHEMTDEEIEKARGEINKPKGEKKPEEKGDEPEKGKDPEEKGKEPEKGKDPEEKGKEPEKGKDPEEKGEEPEKDKDKEKKDKEKEKKEKKAKRVKKRQGFFKSIGAKLKMIAVLMYGERIDGMSQGYKDGIEMLGELYNSYKDNTKEQNAESLDKINEFAKKNISDYKETQAFYKKLVKLSKRIGKYEEKHKGTAKTR